jgi:hypothetical protein
MSETKRTTNNKVYHYNYKCVWLTEKEHKGLKLLSVEKGLTISQTVGELVDRENKRLK